MIGLIFKVFGVSLLLSLGIKYGGPLLSISPTLTNVLLAIWLPSVTLAIVLGWRWRRSNALSNQSL